MNNSSNSSDNDSKRPPPSEENFLKSGIKNVVNVINSGLEQLQVATNEVRRPLASTFSSVQDRTVMVGDKIGFIYERRHQYALELIGGSTLLGAGVMTLRRRGRLAGLLGAAAAGGTAYAVVYDIITLEDVPDILSGRK